MTLAEICQRAAMNAIRESVRHEIDATFRAEERARIREEEGLESEDEEEEMEGPDPVPAITRAHFEVGAFFSRVVRCVCGSLVSASTALKRLTT